MASATWSATIHRIDVPTPFAVGTVNAYLIDDDPLTLIDPGPASTASLTVLEAGLAALDHALEDIALVLLTHQHLDHSGLAGYVAQRSGASVACLDKLEPYLRDFDAMVAAEDEEAAALMVRHGVPQDLIDVVRAFSPVTRRWGAPVSVDRTLADGQLLELRDRALRVIHAPGHSPSDTLFFDEESRVVFAGDHLLPATSSNALVASRLPGTPQRPRYPALLEYRESLAATRALDVEVVYPGHGLPITGGHRALIDERLEQHDTRAQLIVDALREGPSNAHELAHLLWGHKAITQPYLTISEVLGHLDLLIAAGMVVEDASTPVVTFSTTSAGA